jgi:hypothetical protein
MIEEEVFTYSPLEKPREGLRRLSSGTDISYLKMKIKLPKEGSKIRVVITDTTDGKAITDEIKRCEKENISLGASSNEKGIHFLFDSEQAKLNDNPLRNDKLPSISQRQGVPAHNHFDLKPMNLHDDRIDLVVDLKINTGWHFHLICQKNQLMNPIFSNNMTATFDKLINNQQTLIIENQAIIQSCETKIIELTQSKEPKKVSGDDFKRERTILRQRLSERMNELHTMESSQTDEINRLFKKIEAVKNDEHFCAIEYLLQQVTCYSDSSAPAIRKCLDEFDQSGPNGKGHKLTLESRLTSVQKMAKDARAAVTDLLRDDVAE